MPRRAAQAQRQFPPALGRRGLLLLAERRGALCRPVRASARRAEDAQEQEGPDNRPHRGLALELLGPPLPGGARPRPALRRGGPRGPDPAQAVGEDPGRLGRAGAARAPGRHRVAHALLVPAGRLPAPRGGPPAGPLRRGRDGRGRGPRPGPLARAPRHPGLELRRVAPRPGGRGAAGGLGGRQRRRAAGAGRPAVQQRRGGSVRPALPVHG
mmetsp:Transcript_108289/g.293689  ORF Transcript_108289/g.293689 Transcript_108289/m.293689 type:complete len:212 (-) Transcript_108289:336-971(-)